MTRFALINAGLVMEVITDTEEFALSLGYEHTIESATAQPGWIHSNGELSAPVIPGEPEPSLPPEPVTLDSLRAQLKEEATSVRWLKETGGVVVGGLRVGTSIVDQNRIASVLASPVETMDFKAQSGWITLDIESIRGVAATIAAHVQACFSAERRHHEAIDALATIAQAQAYDVYQDWPNT